MAKPQKPNPQKPQKPQSQAGKQKKQKDLKNINIPSTIKLHTLMSGNITAITEFKPTYVIYKQL